jgi:hypothetical protein
VFSLLMNHLPFYEFQKCVERYRGDAHHRGFSCRDYTGVIAFSPSIEPAESGLAQLLLLRVACSVVGNYHSYGLIFTLRRTAS